MTNQIIQTLSSKDGRYQIDIVRGSHGRFSYLEFKWVPYDEEFREKLGREGDWHMGRSSGLYETAEDCIHDARFTNPWLGTPTPK